MTTLDPHQVRGPSLYAARCAVLAADDRHLADRFYRAHGSRMKTRAEHIIWTLNTDRMLAALCLQAVAQGHWLTSLFVDPGYRRAGLASTLLDAACTSVEGPVWLFCQPQLEPLYRQQGFTRSTCLPESLAGKLQRYRRSKDLMAMTRGE